MRRRVSICIISISIIICAAVLLTAVLVSGKREELSEAPGTEEPVQAVPDTEPVVVVNTDSPAVFLYIAKDSSGRVTVYRAETMEVYMETGIRTSDLPEQVRERLSTGIGFSDEAGLFDFLESYSS